MVRQLQVIIHNINWKICLFLLNVAFNFSLISRRCLVATGSSAHFYSAASLKYHAPDTWHDTTPSHIILILGRPVLALPRKTECQASTILTTEVCHGQESNTWPPIPAADTLPTGLLGPIKTGRRSHAPAGNVFIWYRWGSAILVDHSLPRKSKDRTKKNKTRGKPTKTHPPTSWLHILAGHLIKQCTVATTTWILHHFPAFKR